jgi:chaperonin GroEL
MNEKLIKLGDEAREELLKGIDKMYNAVKCTLGPMGKNVIVRRNALAKPHITKDGATVVRDIILTDPVQDVAVQAVKEAAIKTAEIAGDGTTTATVLASNIISAGIGHIKSGANSVLIKQGIEKAVEIAKRSIADAAVKIHAGTDEVKHIAAISANNDPEIGDIIALGMSKVKEEGVIAVETSKTGETTIDVVEGLKFDRGYVSPYFVTDGEKMTTVLTDPYVLVANFSINNMQEIMPVLERVAKTSSSILIIADEIEGDALSTMILNKAKGMLSVVAVKSPHYGEMRTEMLKDIASVVDAKMLSAETGFQLDQIKLGRAKKVIVTKDSTTIIGGAGTPLDIQVRMAQARSMADAAKTDHEIEQHKMRIARLSGGVAILYIGAATETEMNEKRDRVDDALHATRAALEEGIVPGGGITYVNAADAIREYMKSPLGDNEALPHEDFITGMKITERALRKPFEIILENAGLNHEVVRSNIGSGKTQGYDVKNDKYGDMVDLGIIDPAKVARIAIEVASSIACTFITTECIITPEKNEFNQLVK